MFIAEDGPTSTPMERFQAKMPRLIEDFARHGDPRFVLGRDKLPSITSHQRTGIRRFEIRRAPWSTIKTALFLLDAVNPSGADQRSIYRQYLHFVQCNSDEAGAFYDSDEMLLLFIIDIIIQGIKASSAQTYMCSILKMAERSGKKIKGPLVKDLRKMLNMLRLDDEVDHARDIDELQAAEVLNNLSGEAQAMCAFMIITGARVADILQLEGVHVKWTAEYVTVHSRSTKNRKSPDKVFTANYKLDCIDLEACAASLTAVLRSSQTPKSKMFRLSVEEFNAEVKRVWRHGASCPTSYSFRRLAIQRFVKQAVVQEDGIWVVKWARALALTGHLRLETLRTRYLEIDFQTLEGAEMLPEVLRKKPRLPPANSAFWPPPPLLPSRSDRTNASPFLPANWSDEDGMFD